MTTKELWNAVELLPKEGERVRYIGHPPGVTSFGLGVEPNVRWLFGGAEGQVTEKRHTGYPAHRCRGLYHGRDDPDCACDGDGKVSENECWTIVEYEARTLDGESIEGATVARSISPSDEGRLWERITVKEG